MMKGMKEKIGDFNRTSRINDILYKRISPGTIEEKHWMKILKMKEDEIIKLKCEIKEKDMMIIALHNLFEKTKNEPL